MIPSSASFGVGRNGSGGPQAHRHIRAGENTGPGVALLFSKPMPMTTEHEQRRHAGARWEHFPHDADVGVRGFGPDEASAFEQAALAMTAVISEPQRVLPQTPVKIACQAPDAELLFYDWLNALVYEMATRHMLFSQFRVEIQGEQLHARAWGEKIDIPRHQPRVEIKGATFTELQVGQCADGTWRAQCILDV